MKCEMLIQKQKLFTDQEIPKKTAKLSSQVSPENILYTSVSRHVQFLEVIKIEKKNKVKKYKNKERRYLFDEIKSLFEHFNRQLQ